MASSARRRLWRVAAVAGGGGELGPWPQQPRIGVGRRGERGGVAHGEFGSRPRRPWRQRRGSGAHGEWQAVRVRERDEGVSERDADGTGEDRGARARKRCRGQFGLGDPGKYRGVTLILVHSVVSSSE